METPRPVPYSTTWDIGDHRLFLLSEADELPTVARHLAERDAPDHLEFEPAAALLVGELVPAPEGCYRLVALAQHVYVGDLHRQVTGQLEVVSELLEDRVGEPRLQHGDLVDARAFRAAL
jgi:hypothetical protein